MTNTLFLDLETFPLTIQAWSAYEANALSVIKQSQICCFCAKWLGGDYIIKALPDYKGSEHKLVAEIWKLVDKADIVVAHNSDGFDIPRLNSRFAFYGFQPPSPFKTVDTLKVAKRIFGFPSNSLNGLCQYLQIGKKVKTGGFELWEGCMANDKAAWAQMKIYNRRDVELLEALYLKLLPWVNNHPNTSADLTACPKCGSSQLQSRGTGRTLTREYQRFQCQSCGGWAKASKTIRSAKVTNA